MFKQMGEPSPADLLIFGTHVVPDIYGYYRYWSITSSPLDSVCFSKEMVTI